MSSRFHNKMHRYSHHTVATPGIPDSARDPLASQTSPFQGDMYINGGLSCFPTNGTDGFFIGVSSMTELLVGAGVPGLDSFQSVTDRGNTTTNEISVNNNFYVVGDVHFDPVLGASGVYVGSENLIEIIDGRISPETDPVSLHLDQVNFGPQQVTGTPIFNDGISLALADGSFTGFVGLSDNTYNSPLIITNNGFGVEIGMGSPSDDFIRLKPTEFMTDGLLAVSGNNGTLYVSTSSFLTSADVTEFLTLSDTSVIKWRGVEDGNYENPANWDLGRAPLITDVALIDNYENYEPATGTLVAHLAIFNGSIYNSGGLIAGDALFNGNATNRGEIIGNAKFIGDSWNASTGSISGNVLFVGNAYNNNGPIHGIVTNNDTIQLPTYVTDGFVKTMSADGTLVIDDTVYLPLSSSSVITWTNATADSDVGTAGNWFPARVPTVTDMVMISCDTGNGITPPGHGTLNADVVVIAGDQAHANPIKANTVIFMGTSYWDDGIGLNANVVFLDNSYNTGTNPIQGNVIFRDSAYNSGFINGNAEFYDSASNDSGTINGDALFTGATLNAYIINGNAKFTGSSSNTGGGAAGGQIYGDAIFTETASNANWVFGNAVFNGTSTNSGGIIYGDVEFNGGSNTSGGTIKGNATFNEDSYSTSDVFGGNVILNGDNASISCGNSPQYYIGGNVIVNGTNGGLDTFVRGNVILNDTAYLYTEGDSFYYIYGSVTFNDSSTSTAEPPDGIGNLSKHVRGAIIDNRNSTWSRSDGRFAMASGVKTFVWNSEPNDDEAIYRDHGDKTFNINPIGGADGVYIGEVTLASLISNAEGDTLQTVTDRGYITNQTIEVNAVSGFNFLQSNGSYVDGTNATSIGYQTSAVNDYAHAEGSRTLASGVGAHAEGFRTEATASYTHTEGRFTSAGDEGAHAAGAYANAQDFRSWVWNSDPTEGNIPYNSHGGFTFNINPVSGISGFYIGEDNLATLIANEVNSYTPIDMIVFDGGVVEPDGPGMYNQESQILFNDVAVDTYSAWTGTDYVVPAELDGATVLITIELRPATVDQMIDGTPGPAQHQITPGPSGFEYINYASVARFTLQKNGYNTGDAIAAVTVYDLCGTGVSTLTYQGVVHTGDDLFVTVHEIFDGTGNAVMTFTTPHSDPEASRWRISVLQQQTTVTNVTGVSAIETDPVFTTWKDANLYRRLDIRSTTTTSVTSLSTDDMLVLNQVSALPVDVYLSNLSSTMNGRALKIKCMTTSATVHSNLTNTGTIDGATTYSMLSTNCMELVNLSADIWYIV